MHRFIRSGWLRRIAAVAMIFAGAMSGQAALASKVRSDDLVHSALQLDADAQKGRAVFVANCTRCHGQDAGGNAGRAIPSLAGQRQAYLVKQLADFLERERAGLTMHAVVTQQAIADPQTWANVANFLSNLPPLQKPQTGDGRNLDLGEAIYQEQCASCHAEDGRGDDDGFIPSLRNQHYSYLAAQIRNISTWHRANMEEDIVRFLGSLKADETLAVSDYLSRMRSPAHDRAVMQPDGSLRDGSEIPDAECRDPAAKCGAPKRK